MDIKVKNGILYVYGDAIKRFFSESGDCYDGLTVSYAQIIGGRLQVNGIFMSKVRTVDGENYRFSDVKISPNVTQFHAGSGDNIGGDYVAGKTITQTHTGNGDNIGGSKFKFRF